MRFDRRDFLTAAVATVAIPAQPPRVALRPEDFGARGDGVTNDTRAFQALAAEVNRRGGGTISFGAGRTYVVGAQSREGGRKLWNPTPILELHNLTSPLSIIGNGARLRAQAGLRFGTFDRATDQPVNRHMPNLDPSELASAYRGLVLVQNSHAPIVIRDIELDGNIDRMRIGGRYGDTGWQIPGTGLHLEGNRESETIVNVLTHHHGTDGVTIVGTDKRSTRSRFSHVISRYNGRQGLSVTGGRGYDFEDCEFSHSGRSAVHSAPGAGVDIEAEAGPIRDLSFTRCKFIDNAGCGLVADSGDSEGVRFASCEFVGTTSWSAWPKKPHFTFENCRFVGSVVHAFPDPDPSRAARFLRCLFTDDPRLSPTGKVYTAGGPIVNLGASVNVLFDACTFRLVADGVLPWSWKAIYRDCRMIQHSPKKGMTKGKYLGWTSIDGAVDLYGSMIVGTLMVNGKAMQRGPVGVAAW